jgi:hypothetical protein
MMAWPARRGHAQDFICEGSACWARLHAICDFVHAHLQFNYMHADPKRGSVRAFEERRGVCRDFAQLAITFCRSVNIPARCCAGYLGDIGVPPVPAPMDYGLRRILANLVHFRRQAQQTADW